MADEILKQEISETEEENLELTPEQAQRNDEVYEAVFELCKVLTENPDMDWDMEAIGGIAEYAVDTLVNKGFRIRFPAVVTDGDCQYIEEYVNYPAQT